MHVTAQLNKHKYKAALAALRLEASTLEPATPAAPVVTAPIPEATKTRGLQTAQTRATRSKTTVAKARDIKDKSVKAALPKKKRTRVKKRVYCTMCDTSFAGDLGRHKKTHFPPTITCKYVSLGCERMFRQNWNAVAHAETCTYQGPVLCGVSNCDTN